MASSVLFYIIDRATDEFRQNGAFPGSAERAFSHSVDEFLEVYPSYIGQVRPELNGLFREEDYPSAEKLRAKFGVKLEVLPIPSGDEFRVTLSEEEQARVARDIDESVRQSMNRGTKDLWVRLTDVVTHMVDKLNDPDSRFHASLVTNVSTLSICFRVST